jgi:hypothetical protein
MISCPAVLFLVHCFLPIETECHNTKQQTQAEPQFCFQSAWLPEERERMGQGHQEASRHASNSRAFPRWQATIGRKEIRPQQENRKMNKKGTQRDNFTSHENSSGAK